MPARPPLVPIARASTQTGCKRTKGGEHVALESDAPISGGTDGEKVSRSEKSKLRPSLSKCEDDNSATDPLRITLRLISGGCPHCGRKPFYEGFHSSLCCRNGKDAGKILLEPITKPLSRAFASTSFQQNSIRINDYFGVSSLAITGGRQQVTSASGTVTPQSYKILGTTSTRILPPNANSGHCPVEWFLSAGSYPAQAHFRSQISDHCNVEELEACMQKDNALHAGFAREKDAYANAEDGALHFRKTGGAVTVKFYDSHYEPEENAEVGAYIGLKGNASREIVVRKKETIDPKTGRPQEAFIPAVDPRYEPLRYPLIYTKGELGWGRNPEEGKGRRSLLQWLQQVALREPRIRQLRALGQQWLVDNYSRVEDLRLHFVAKDQLEEAKKLAFEDFEAGGDGGDFNMWEGVTIPDSFIKSDAWFKERLNDSMTLLARYEVFLYNNIGAAGRARRRPRSILFTECEPTPKLPPGSENRTSS